MYNSVEAVNEESQWSVASLSPHLCTCKEQNVILGHEGNTDSWTLWLLKKNCLIKSGGDTFHTVCKHVSSVVGKNVSPFL